MRISISSPIPDLGSKPGPGRPGWSAGTYDFQFEVSQGQVGINVLPNTSGQGFTVKWQNGTEQFINAGTTNLQSPTTDAGIISINKKTDQGFCDDFAVASGQQFVTKVISWGSNPWNRLVSAFENCVNLTSVEKTKLYGVNTMMESTFEQCSSLVSADLSELNVSNNISIYRMFKDCTALQFLSIKNDNSKLNLGTLGTAQSQIEAFMNVGSGVSTGCEVVIKDTEFVNVRTSTTVLSDMFRNVRFKDTSDLSGLSFSGLAFDYGLLFQYAHVPQDNSFLNISNWSFNHTNEWSSQSLFFRFNNDAASGVNTDIDTTGWNFGKVTGLSQWFYYCNIRTIRGLSTWTRDNSVLFVSLFRAFNRWFNAKIPANDNFSSSFWANSRLDGNQAEMFFYAGNTSSDAETGSFPNLNGLEINATSLIDAFRLSKWNTPVDFTGVNQYTGAGQVARTDCQRLFQSINIIGSNRRIAFNINGLKVQNARTMFYVSNVQYIDISSVVDFSTCFSFQFMFLGGTPFYDGNVTLPTNMDFSSATSWNGSTPQNQFPEISLSTCQIDNLIRRIHTTLPVPPSSSVNQIYSPLSQVTEAPSVVQAQEAELVSNGWTITANSTDATLPFAYPSYSFDPEVTQSVTPTTIPTGGVFSTATAGVTVDPGTGVVSWDSTYMGLPIIRCTYTDGCYNEVQMSMLITVDNNYSMAFDGTGAYIETNYTGLNGLSQATISIWAKTSNILNGDFLYGNRDTSNNGVACQTWTDGRIYFYVVSGYNLYFDMASAGIQDDQWFNIVFVFNGSESINTNKVKMYVNQNPIAYTTNTTFPTTLAISSKSFKIGNDEQANAYWNGQIDEVAIFNRALTDSQVKLIYDANSTNKSIKLSSLPGGAPVAWYRMGD